MNISQFDKARKIYDSIKELDKEIIELERQAMIVANNEVRVLFDIKIENLTPDPIGINNIGSDLDTPEMTMKSIYDSFIRPTMHFYEYVKTPQPVDAIVLKNKVSPYTALHILGFLIRDKQEKREHRLEQLKLMGLKTD